MKKIIFVSFIFGVAIYVSACKKFVEVQIPKNQLLTASVFEDSIQATSAILGIYVYMMQNFALVASNGGITIYTGLTSDELYTTSSSTDEKQFYSNSITPNNSINGILWSYSYSLIYQTNACIEGLEKSKTISLQTKNRLIGECKFIRAFFYFNLVNLFGDIPLVTSTNYKINQVLPRSSINSIYDQIIADLQFSKNTLPADYMTSGKLRPNQYTASALLSKTYLYLKNWEQAEIESNEIIESMKYSLETDINKVFVSNSKETIWELQPVLSSRATLEGYNLIPALAANSRPKYPITDTLLNSFEIGDFRKKENNWIKSKTIGGQIYYFPYKYKERTVNTENYKVFRLAEQYLIRAEARANVGKLTGANSATEDLNIVRNRAGLLNFSGSTKEELLSAIQHERQTELFCEWGNRWFDLKRNDVAGKQLLSIKADWQNTDIYYPIPQVEINNNPFLIQNDGY